MWFIETLIKLLSFTIEWFWTYYEEYKEQGSVLKIILLFIISLSGLLLLSGSLIWLALFLFTERMDIVIFMGLIIWLYAYVRHKMTKTSVEPIVAPQDTTISNEILYQKVRTRINMVHKVMLEVSQKIATKLHCVAAADVNEIIDTNYQYDIVDNVVFFIIRLEKEDIGKVIDMDTAKQYKQIIQAKTDHLTNSYQFREIGFPTNCDSFGEPLTRICIERVMDKGQYLYIWVAFDLPEYRDYLYRETVAKQNNQITTSPPDANWDEFNV